MMAPMKREWMPVETDYDSYVEIRARLLPPLRGVPEASAIGLAQLAFAMPPGRIARFLGDTLEKRVQRGIKYVQRWCDAENKRRSEVGSIGDSSPTTCLPPAHSLLRELTPAELEALPYVPRLGLWARLMGDTFEKRLAREVKQIREWREDPVRIARDKMLRDMEQPK